MNALTPELHDALAGLLSYPKQGFAQKASEDVAAIAAACPDAGRKLEHFLEYVRSTPDSRLEEEYTRIFEVSPDCCLEVGWQVFGEQYNRGIFLVRMRQVLRDLNLPEGTELPDHLTSVLPVLGRLESEDASILAEKYVAPAVEKMAVALAAGGNPYEGVLDAILVVTTFHQDQRAEAVA